MLRKVCSIRKLSGYSLLREKVVKTSLRFEAPASSSVDTSYNVVYLIKCRTCIKVYIGETGRRLGDRFRQHLRSTRQTNTDLPVGRHFASPEHVSTDILLSVIQSGSRDTQNRRLFQARMVKPQNVTSGEDFISTLPFYKLSKSVQFECVHARALFLVSARK